ncbi:hypothetical protein [Persicirhabdus sediminis]|uniref:Uncharacterized protein n=1 Tax=Persicirhabdus sediminis TaxID=454144 RepID=A0A8J7MBA1_9BACT|nr:hypothetical protein [Persicirhabdus sediminis]MBK1790374.1 hypothetical protein [Persicirhabdus sediminis]
MQLETTWVFPGFSQPPAELTNQLANHNPASFLSELATPPIRQDHR